MASPKRHEDEFEVDEHLVRRLLRAQFPQWADLPLKLVEPPGTDHTIYRLGDELVVRLPIMEYATRQAVKEAKWIPVLAPQVPLLLPTPVAIGEPGDGYPWTWSIVSWIDGERATAANLDPVRAATDLAAFVRALHRCDATGGPKAGASTGGRGLPLSVWDDRLEPWVAKLDGDYDPTDALTAWEDARRAPDWDRPPVWFHGARGWVIGPALIGLSYYRDVPHLRELAHSHLKAALSD